MNTTNSNVGIPLWTHSTSVTRSAFGHIDEERSPVRGDADPSPGTARSVLVVCESGRGRAGAASEAVAVAAAAKRAVAGVATIDDVAAADVEAADAVVAGCWMPGRAPFGDGPMLRMVTWIESLPPLNGKPVGVFCTYRFFPHTFADVATRTAETEHCLAERFERKGATLVAKKAIHFGSIDTDAADLLGRVLEHVA